MSDPLVRYGTTIGIIVAALTLLGVWALIPQRVASGRGKQVYTAALVLVAVAATAAYFQYGWLRFGRYMNPHDVFHYYVGAKYSAEHRYFDLYRAALVADDELGLRFPKKSIRNLDDTRKWESVERVLGEKDEIKSHFSAERWEEFRSDIAYFRSLVPRWKWGDMLRDKGYNATPVWNAIAQFVAESAPTSSVWAMRGLTYIDLALVVLMLCAVAWAFGTRVMLFVLIFHGTNFMMSFVHIKGAFLRLDWVVCLVAAMCCLKKERFKTAGALLAYAGLARIFPLVFCFGPGMRLLYDIAGWGRAKLRGHERPLDTRYIKLFGSFTAVFVTLVLATVLLQGVGVWRDFLAKIAQHDSDLSTTRVGFKYLFMMPWEGFREMAAGYERNKALFYAFCLVALVPTAIVARRVRHEETIAIGYVAAFFLVAPTFYYHVMLVVPALMFFARAGESPTMAAGAAYCFCVSILGFALMFSMKLGATLFLILSGALLVLCAVLVAGLALGAGSPAARLTSG